MKTTSVLLIDDDEIILNTLQAGLSSLNYNVDSCSSGQQAIQMYRNNTPDIVVLDYQMPDMSGTQTAKALLDIEHRPIIMLSAHSDVQVVREAIDLGVSTYLIKPVEADRLAPSIEATLARFGEVQALLKQGAHIQSIMEKHRVINNAVGIVMERAGLPNDVAFEKLRRLARNQRRSLRDISFEIVDAASTVNDIVAQIKQLS